MAEHPDVTLVKRGYEAFNSADIATLTELIADDAVQTMVGDNLVSGEFKGRDNILGMYAKLGELTNGTYAVEIEQTFTDGNGTVVVVHRQTAERDGQAPRQPSGADLQDRRRQDRVTDRHERRHRQRRRVLQLTRTVGAAHAARRQPSAMEIACFGHCWTACSHFARSSSGGFSCRT